MTDQQLRDEVITLLLAGHQTTALTLSWTWYLLAQYLEVKRRLHQELDAVLGGRLPTAGDQPKLPYADKVIREGSTTLSTRMVDWPDGQSNPTVTPHQTTNGGMFFAKGTPDLMQSLPAFQRRHTSSFCSAESPNRLPCFINTTFENGFIPDGVASTV